MTRQELISHICESLRLNLHQARAMANRPGDWYVLRAEYPGGAPNPIVGFAADWPYSSHDEQWHVTRDGKVYSLAEVPGDDPAPAYEHVMRQPCGCPLDADCTGYHPGALGTASGMEP